MNIFSHHLFTTIVEFLSRNEGEIFGGFLSGLVALFAFYLGIRFQNRKDRRLYSGNLFSLLTELEWKKGTIDRILKELITVKTQSVKEKRIVTTQASVFLNIENLLKIRDNIISYESANSQIMLLINVIINLSLEINPSLDFSRAIQYLESKENDDNIAEGIAGYFDNLIDDQFQKLIFAISNLQKLIRSEINKYPDAEALKEYNI